MVEEGNRSEGHTAPRLDAATTDFDAFYAANHSAMVRGLALALGDDTLGREAADEGFTRALQRWRTVSGYRNPAGWVYRAGLNWARSRRRRRRRELLLDDDTTERGQLDQRPDRAVSVALRRLPVEQRAVVVARYYLDWSEADIAAALDIPPGTVKSRASRALSELATILEDHR